MEMRIGKSLISKANKDVFVIAEIGNNHNGDFDRAIHLIDQAIDAGADCVKFQIRDLPSLYRESTLKNAGDDLSVEYTLDLIRRFELSFEDHKKLSMYAAEKGSVYFCTPWDSKSIKKLEELGVGAYKVASADFTNLPLIDELVSLKKPLILSTGMSRESEILKVVDHLKKSEANFAILHCNSTYPAPFHGINLNYLTRLQTFHDLVGYSGHERGTSVTLGAVALGAKIIERHLTLDRNMEGPDHAASLEPNDFKKMVDGIRELEEALGRGDKRIVSQGEMINRENLGKSLVAKRNLTKGTTISRDDIDVKSPGQGLSPLMIESLIGKKIDRDMSKEDYFFKSDIEGHLQAARNYRFKRKWGIPVRFHDYAKFTQNVDMPLVEFHLSYKDMDLNLADYFSGTYSQDFVVHAPELFEGSHLMDLATPDDSYRNFSIEQTQRVIDLTRELKRYFPKTERPQIVANVGGFSRDQNLTSSEIEKGYQIFLESLQKLDRDGVEIIPQTMAPFPWHFGGQRYQNLFVHPKEVAEICEKQGLRMCLDVSHSFLTCNYFGYDFYEFLETVGPFTTHLHLGDSTGVDGEGLQVGDGEIDFPRMAEVLNRTCPDATFIPEIWQGHKNGGEGFWVALKSLEGLF